MIVMRQTNFNNNIMCNVHRLRTKHEKLFLHPLFAEISALRVNYFIGNDWTWINFAEELIALSNCLYVKIFIVGARAQVCVRNQNYSMHCRRECVLLITDRFNSIIRSSSFSRRIGCIFKRIKLTNRKMIMTRIVIILWKCTFQWMRMPYRDIRARATAKKKQNWKKKYIFD